MEEKAYQVRSKRASKYLINHNFNDFKEVDYLDLKANLEIAKRHCSAHKIYEYNFNDDASIVLDTCQCCTLPIENGQIIKKLDLCFDENHMSGLFTSISVYLLFLKFLIVSLLIAFSMQSVEQIIVAFNAYDELNTFCVQSKNSIFSNCTQFQTFNESWLYSMSYENIEIRYNISTLVYSVDFIPLGPDLAFTSFLMILVLFVVNFVYFQLANSIIVVYDIEKISPSNFTVMISSIDLEDVTDESKIIETLSILNLTPIYVNLAYKSRNLCDLKHQQIKSQRNIDYCLWKRKDFFETSMCCLSCEEFDNFKCCNWRLFENKTNLQRTKYDSENLLKTIESERNKLKFMAPQNFAGVIFATFQKEVEAIKYYGLFPKSLPGYIFAIFRFILTNVIFRWFFSELTQKLNYQRIKYTVKLPGEPEEIIWQNLEFSYSKTFRSILIYLICIIFIFISFGIMYGFNIAEGYLYPTPHGGVIYLLSFIFAVIVEFLNTFLSHILVFLMEYESHEYLSELNFSYCLKLGLFSFVNSGIVPIAANLLSGRYYDTKVILYINIFMIFLFNAFYLPLSYFFKFSNLSRKAMRNILSSRWYYGKDLKMNQKEINKIFEDMNFDYQIKLAYFARVSMMSFFYIPLFPVGTIIIATGLFFFYIVEKCNIINHYKPPEVISPKLVIYFFKFFKLSIFFFSVSTYVYYQNMYYKYSLTCIILSGVLLIIPYHNFLYSPTLTTHTIKSMAKEDYSENYIDFNNDYERTNPFTKIKGFTTYFNELLEFGEINQIDHQEIMKYLAKNEDLIIDEYFRKNSSMKKFQNHYESRIYSKMINQYFIDYKLKLNNGEDFQDPEFVINLINNNIYSSRKSRFNLRNKAKSKKLNTHEKKRQSFANENNPLNEEKLNMSEYDKDYELPNENIIEPK